MNKEQIIINDIDVSECENFRPKDRFTCYPYICNCHEKPDCNFKQQARKTQECEQKEKELLSNEKIINKLMKEVDELKQECEELKKENQELRNSLSDSLMFRFTSQDKEVDRYCKALEEIEKHIESYKKQCHIPNNCVDNRLCSTCFLGGGNELGENILDIINKAKGEEDEHN